MNMSWTSVIMVPCGRGSSPRVYCSIRGSKVGGRGGEGVLHDKHALILSVVFEKSK